MFALLSLLAMLVLAAPASARKRHSVHRSGTLQLVVSGLGGGKHEHVTVTGPRGFHRMIRGTRSRVTFQRVHPGAYRISAAPTKAPGGLNYAEPQRLQARVLAGRRTLVEVHYGNVVSRAVRMSTPAPSQVVGDPTDPSAIVVPAIANVKVGQIVWFEPSGQFPIGVFSKVTSVRPSAGNVIASLVDASLGQAFPQLNLAEQIPIGGGAQAHARDTAGTGPSAHAADESPSFSFTFPAGVLGDCGSSASTPPSVDFPLSARASLAASMHISQGTLQDASFIINFTGSAGINVFLPDGTGCEKDGEGVALAHFLVWIGYVPIPATIEAVPHVGVELDGDLKINARATLNAHAGIVYRGGHASPDTGFSVSGSANGEFGGGKFTLGPKLELALGLAHTLDANVDTGLYDYVSGNASSWQSGLELSGGAGLEAKGVGSLSVELLKKDIPLFGYPVPKAEMRRPALRADGRRSRRPA